MVYQLLMDTCALVDVYQCVLVPLAAFTLLAVLLYVGRAKSREHTKVQNSTVNWSLLLDQAKTSCVCQVKEVVSREGLDVNAYTDKDTHLTLLLSACLGGNTELVKYLIEKGANYTATTSNGDTTLILATYTCCSHKSSDTALVDFLACKGINVNAQNSQGDTALNIAALYGNTRLISILLQYGADPTIANHKGVRAINFAGNSGNIEASKLLEKYIQTNELLVH